MSRIGGTSALRCDPSFYKIRTEFYNPDAIAGKLFSDCEDDAGRVSYDRHDSTIEAPTNRGPQWDGEADVTCR
jgi:hypothetical protein